MSRRRIPRLLVATGVAAAISAISAISGAAAGDRPVQKPPANRIERDIAAEAQRNARADSNRARQLDTQEAAVRAIEARMARRSSAAGADAEGADASVAPAPETERFEQLARIFQAMKPASAAQVLQQLELPVQLGVAQRMRERATAQVIAAMDPQKAAALSMALARGRVR